MRLVATARPRPSTAITGYPPVTGWSRRKMTGCPLVGTSIAPDGVASLASSRVSVRSTGAAPESRRPTRFDCAVTVHVCVRNADRPAAVNQSSRGPNRTYKSVGLPGFGRSVGHGCGRPTPASHAVDAVRMASRCLAAIGPLVGGAIDSTSPSRSRTGCCMAIVVRSAASFDAFKTVRPLHPPGEFGVNVPFEPP